MCVFFFLLTTGEIYTYFGDTHEVFQLKFKHYMSAGIALDWVHSRRPYESVHVCMYVLLLYRNVRDL